MFSIKADLRKSFGSNVSNRLRKQGKIPIIVYNKKENITLTLFKDDVKLDLLNKSIEIKIEKRSLKVKLQSIQLHPVKKNIIHMDFILEK